MPLFEVKRGLGAGYGNGATPAAWLNTMAQQVMIDFRAAMIMDGRGFQVKAGTITTPIVGDVPITDTRCEYCADAASGTTIIPIYNGIGVRLGTGTLLEMGLKSVATASTAGTAFVPLPLKSDGAAAVSTARAAAHAVTVTAELATTTLRHWEWANPVTVGAGNDLSGLLCWEPIAPPVLVGPRCVYVQIGAATTGPSYYAHLDYLEVPTVMLNPS